MRAAAVQIEAELGNVDHNLAACERQVDAAAAAGATWVALPEFFSTGVAFLPSLVETAPTPDGEPTQLLRSLARRHGIHVGGSTIVRDVDGHLRNAFVLAGPDGALLGRHDKDLPTMWENALYTRGADPGRIRVSEDLTVGVALCWELMRTQTVTRLRGQVDVVMGGSGWWSIPSWPLFGAAEARNRVRATSAPAVFARHVGSPVIHGAHAGAVPCRLLGTPLPYRGHFEGGAQICDADGRMLAFRHREQVEGFVMADVAPRRSHLAVEGGRFWLQRRGALPAAFWAYQGVVGRRHYRRAVEQQLRAAVNA